MVVDGNALGSCESNRTILGRYKALVSTPCLAWSNYNLLDSLAASSNSERIVISDTLMTNDWPRPGRKRPVIYFRYRQLLHCKPDGPGKIEWRAGENRCNIHRTIINYPGRPVDKNCVRRPFWNLNRSFPTRGFRVWPSTNWDRPGIRSFFSCRAFSGSPDPPWPFSRHILPYRFCTAALLVTGN